MAQQKIAVENFGADSRRVLDALTPINGVAAPAVHADYIGQIFVDEVLGDTYISVATDSVSAADDWVKFELTIPVVKTGAGTPAVHADFIGQIYVQSVGPAIFIAVATDSVAPADDWKEMAFEPQA